MIGVMVENAWSMPQTSDKPALKRPVADTWTKPPKAMINGSD